MSLVALQLSCGKGGLGIIGRCLRDFWKAGSYSVYQVCQSSLGRPPFPCYGNPGAILGGRAARNGTHDVQVMHHVLGNYWLLAGLMFNHKTRIYILKFLFCNISHG